jgi:NCAIR mutase (PurE)-related protein
VREINLSNCGIGDKGCESLAAFLASGNTTVAFINLEKNGISAAVCAYQ